MKSKEPVPEKINNEFHTFGTFLKTDKGKQTYRQTDTQTETERETGRQTARQARRPRQPIVPTRLNRKIRNTFQHIENNVFNMGGKNKFQPSRKKNAGHARSLR